MGITYQQATDETLSLLTEARRRWHAWLDAEDVRIDVLFASVEDEETGEVQHALKLHGFPAAATIKAVPLKQRALGQGDALLTIDDHTWCGLGRAQRMALLDHELTHLAPALNEDNTVKRDDLGRPKLKMRPHDHEVTWFDDVAKRHGRNALEVQSIAVTVGAFGQVAWNFDAAVPQAAE